MGDDSPELMASEAVQQTHSQSSCNLHVVDSYISKDDKPHQNLGQNSYRCHASVELFGPSRVIPLSLPMAHPR